MKFNVSLMSLLLALGISAIAPISTSAQTQMSSSRQSEKVAQNLDQPLETLPNANNIRFRALKYERSETRPGNRSILEVIRREFPTGDQRYLYNFVDLNGDGQNEVIVYMTSACGTGGCSMLILQPTSTGFELVSRHTIVNNPVVVSNSTTQGWRDIVLFVAGGGAKPGYHSLKFDGSAYPRNPSTAPQLAAGTIVSGTALVANQVRPGVGLPLMQKPAENSTGLLTQQQQASLKALNIPIAVPSSVPDGYTVSKVSTEPCKGKCRFGPNYGIVYRNVKQDKCFAIEATGGGVGGVPSQYAVPVETKLFGKVSLLFGGSTGTFKPATPEQLAQPQSGILNDWASATGTTSPFYRIAGGDIVQRSYYNGKTDQCRNRITPNEAAAVLRSLSWLK